MVHFDTDKDRLSSGFKIISNMLGILLLGATSAFAAPVREVPKLVPLNDLIPKEVRERIDARRQQRQLAFGVDQAQSQVVVTVPRVDLRSRDTSVKKQFGGTCTTFGLVAAMENVMGGTIHLSERDAWSKYKKYSVKTAVSTLLKKGIVEEKWWPQSKTWAPWGYSNHKQFKLQAVEYFEDDIQKAVQALEAGKPLYFGVSTPMDMIACDDRIGPDTKVSSGGHAFAVVGFEADPTEPAGGYFLLKNSWGSSCGDHGYQWFPFSLCSRNDMYCMIWAIDGAMRVQ